MQASLDNIRAFINDKFASQDIQPDNNPILADSSPVPVDLGPHQTQTDPSVRSPCIDYGSEGEAQEPVQVGWPPLPFSSLQAAGIVVPQGVMLGDRIDRAPSPAAVHVRLRWLRSMDSCRNPWEVVVLCWLRLSIRCLRCRVVRCSLSCARLGPRLRKPGWWGLCLQYLTRCCPPCGGVCRSERGFVVEDDVSSLSLRAVVSRGHLTFLRLWFLLCPGAAP